MDPEEAARVAAIWMDAEEAESVPPTTDSLAFKVAVYRRDSLQTGNMYCIDPRPVVERCPTCNRIL